MDEHHNDITATLFRKAAGSLAGALVAIVLTGVIAALLFINTSYSERQTALLLAVVHIILIVGCALRTAVLNANVDATEELPAADYIVNPLILWLTPGLIGLVLIVECFGVAQIGHRLPVYSEASVQTALLFWLMWVTLGQLAGRLNRGKPINAVYTVFGMLFAIWVCSHAVGNGVWNSVYLVLPDMQQLLTIASHITSSHYFDPSPYLILHPVILIAVLLPFSFRAYNMPNRPVFTWVSGLLLTAFMSIVLVYRFGLANTTEYDKYVFWPGVMCGAHSVQIPFLVMGLLLGLLSSTSRDAWQAKKGLMQLNILPVALWSLVHILVFTWFYFGLSGVNKDAVSTRLDISNAPLLVTLLIANMALLYQALRLKWGVRWQPYMLIMCGLLFLPMGSYDQIYGNSSSNLISMAIYASQTSCDSCGHWLVPMLLITIACCGYLCVVVRGLRRAS